MRFAFIDQYRGPLSHKRLCGLMGRTDRGLRVWRSRPASRRQRTNMVLLAHIREQFRFSWAVRSPWRRMKRDTAIRALNMTIGQRRPPKDCIHHTDRGSQYCAHYSQKILRQHSFQVSMSRTGNCYDNAAGETFFKTIKTELLWQQSWQTRRNAEIAIFEYINSFYNPRRRHSARGWKSPLAFETKTA